VEGEEGLLAGWYGFLDQLDAYLGGAEINREESASQWRSLHAPYCTRLDNALRG
jgi:hypothetical protein